jgi:hypothetical protein
LEKANKYWNRTLKDKPFMPPKSRFKQEEKPSEASGRRTQSTARGQTRDNLIVASKVIEGISEATDLLKPLKTACQVLRLVLETTQVRRSGQSHEEKCKVLRRIGHR